LCVVPTPNFLPTHQRWRLLTSTSAGAVSRLAAPTPNDDLGKKIGDGLKGVSNAVSAVGNAENTVDQAKKLLGFWGKEGFFGPLGLGMNKT